MYDPKKISNQYSKKQNWKKKHRKINTAFAVGSIKNNSALTVR